MIVWIILIFFVANSDNVLIKNLIGEPDYHQVHLYWEAEDVPENGYQIRYCELQSWESTILNKCRISNQNRDMLKYTFQDGIYIINTNIKGLRMATTYSFEIKDGKRDRYVKDQINNEKNLIILPTKGFTAKATLCLPNMSEIQVSTGPYFGGRISVEETKLNAGQGGCSIDGEPKNPKDIYTLKINYTQCASLLVNETTIATFVLVQENLSILTHSTRRFLVLCTHQSEYSATVFAGINLPTYRKKPTHRIEHLKGKK